MFVNQIDEVIDHYNKIGLFNEELIIKNKIQNYLMKGYSLKKVKSYLVKNKFHEELISKELKSLDSNNSLKESLVKRFIEKKLNYQNIKTVN